MPVYGFKCKQCRHRFSLLLSWAEKQQAACPRCRSKALEEDFSGYGAGSKVKSAQPANRFT